MLGALHEVFVNGCTHFKPLVVCQVKLLSTVRLTPVLKPVALNLPEVHLSVLVSLLPGVVPHPILVQPVELSDVIVEV